MWWSRKKDSGNTDSLDDRIRKQGLERVGDRIKASARDCIRLKAYAANEEAIPLGATKLGGWPDLPDTTEWPGGSAMPMSFIAQINTSDLPDFDGKSDLPADALLSFFYDIATSPRGYHPRDRGAWKVLAIPFGTPLGRRETRGVAPIKPCVFTTRKDLSLPDPASDEVGTWQMDEYEQSDYVALYEALMPKHAAIGANHQLLGYASTIQGDMHILCQLASQGVYWKTVAGPSLFEEEWRPMREAAEEWRLLLQVDSDRNALLDIDGGRIYFYIRDSALKARTFDELWVVTQIRGGSPLP